MGVTHIYTLGYSRVKQAVKYSQAPGRGGCLQGPFPLGIKYMPCLESFILNPNYIRRQVTLRREV